MKLYNSLTRKIEEVVPINASKVGVYLCGPTVYNYVSIGNWRAYTIGGLLVRAFEYEGYKVNYVMNITDVGHLTGDNEGDADTGEDRLEKGARREGKTAWEVAEFYTRDFLLGFDKLNLRRPNVFCRATEHIPEQIQMVQKIEKAGFAYKIDDGIYFDVGAYEAAGNMYGQLSTLDELRVGARVEPVPGKKGPKDFALWKFSPVGEKRQMEWESPWGVGFPGWHIECSAMSTKYLGDQFDIHIGGEDLRSTHHPNEIAQSEAATGKKPFVKYWVHGAFLQVDGGRMGKSLGNAYTLQDIEAKGFTAMDLRYFYLTGHYRKQLNFTWEALESARRALSKLINQSSKLITTTDNLKIEETDEVKSWKRKFEEAIDNDLNMPEALAVVWQMVGSDLDDGEKYALILDFDRVLGLGLDKVENEEVPDAVSELAERRSRLRGEKQWEEADGVREEIEKLGWVVEDTEEGSRVVKK